MFKYVCDGLAELDESHTITAGKATLADNFCKSETVEQTSERVDHRSMFNPY